MSDVRSLWLLRACIVLLLLLTLAWGRLSEWAAGRLVINWALLGAPWLVALVLPVGRVHFAGAMLAGASIVVLPPVLIGVMLSILTSIDSSTGLLLLIALSIAGTACLGFAVSIKTFAGKRLDLGLMVAVGFWCALYEGIVLQYVTSH